MSLKAEIKSDSTTGSQTSDVEVASPLSSSEEKAEVPQSLGEQRMDMEKSERLGLDKQRTDKDSLGNEVGTCKSQNLPVAESITNPGDAGGDVVTVSSLEAERTDKEACEREGPSCAGSGPTSDVVSTPPKGPGPSAEVEFFDDKRDAQESVCGVGKLTVASPVREKSALVEDEEAKEAAEDKPDHGMEEKLDNNLNQPDVEIPEVKQEEKEEDTTPDEDEDDVLMGYHFNKDEVLVDKHGKQFEFRRYAEHARNQKRYEKLGEKINDYIYDLLETRCKLKKIYIPLDAKDGEPRSFIFVSEGAFKAEDKLIIFIHGSGVVRAGQWARSLIINHSLTHGTQIPYIEQALKDGYEVIVLNTNLNSMSKNRWPSHDELIRGSEDPESHALYVWENLIEKEIKAKHIAIVAHSYGGVVTKELVNQKHDQFAERVFAIAFTDSVHDFDIICDSPDVIQFFRDHARNWVTSSLPVDESVKGGLRFINDAPRVSAGHEKHEWTSWSSLESIFKFLDHEYHIFVTKNDENSKAQTPAANL